MFEKIALTLFLLFLIILEIVTQVKPRKDKTFIDFNRTERKIKEYPFVYTMICLQALIVVVICLVGICVVWCGPLNFE